MTIASITGVRERHVVVATPPDDATATARLVFNNGAENFAVATDPTLDSLLEATFGEPPPVVYARDHDVHIEYPLAVRLLRRPARSSIQLTTQRPWSIEIHGGAAHLEADLRAVDVSDVTIHGSAAHTRLRLGRPRGETVLRVRSLSHVRLDLTETVPLRVFIDGGATNVRIGPQQWGASNGLDYQTAEFAAATDRYVLIARGGVANLTISADTPREVDE